MISVLAALAGSTRAAVVFLTNFGVRLQCRIIDVPASTGYGEPIQRLFKLKDGEKVVAALSLDPRVIGDIKASTKHPDAPPRPCGSGLQRRIRSTLQPRATRRAKHACGAAVRTSRRQGPRSSGRENHRQGRC